MRRGKRANDYEWLRAWGMWRGYPQEVIEQQVQQAHEQNASHRVVYYDLSTATWYTVDDLNSDVRRLLIAQYESRHGKRGVKKV